LFWQEDKAGQASWATRALFNEHVYSPKTAEKTDRKKAVYIYKLQANYNTQRTNDHKN